MEATLKPNWFFLGDNSVTCETRYRSDYDDAHAHAKYRWMNLNHAGLNECTRGTGAGLREKDDRFVKCD